MKSYKHSKFEVIHIEPNEKIEELTFKRDFFVTPETEDFICKNIKKHNFVVLDKKEEKIYGIVTLEINEWDGIATFDFNEIENHPDKNAMHKLVMLFCQLSKDISKNSKTIVFKNHLFNKDVLDILWKESFRYKNADENDDIFIRLSERETETLFTVILLIVSMILLFMNIAQ